MTISRRSALKAIAAGSAMAAAAPVIAAPGRERPNILWLVSEDNNPFIGAYGDPAAVTPNIDALARRGVLYRNVYSPAPVCAPTRFGILTGTYAESCSPAQHMRAVAKLPSGMRTYPEYMRNAGYYCTNNSKTDYNCDVDPARIWDVSGNQAHWKRRARNQPFLAVFNSMTTHESSMFRPVPERERFKNIRIPAYLPDTPAVRNDFASYYALMNKMDGEIGARLAELEADGLADDTIVFYYSDNGGVLPRSKRYCYDEGLRVALVAYFPPKWRHLCPAAPGTEVTAPVNLIDLPPTLLSLADMSAPPHMQGRAFMGRYAKSSAPFAFGMRNRMDERYDFVRTVTDGRYRYIRNYMPHRIWGMRGDFEWMLKSYQSWDEKRLAGELNPQQSRFFQTKPFEELYDIAADPDQLSNLAEQRGQQARMRSMRAALDAHMLRIRDNGFIPEGTPAEGYHASRDEAVYPLKRIMALGQAAARSERRKLGLFRHGLTDRNPIVRHWSAMGLLILKAKAAPARDALSAMARSDEWPANRVVAAEALCHVGALPEGAAVLASIATSNLDFPARLMALNALDSVDAAARLALPAIKQVSDETNEYLVRAARPLVARIEGTYRPDISYGRGTTARTG